MGYWEDGREPRQTEAGVARPSVAASALRHGRRQAVEQGACEQRAGMAKPGGGRNAVASSKGGEAGGEAGGPHRHRRCRSSTASIGQLPTMAKGERARVSAAALRAWPSAASPWQGLPSPPRRCPRPATAQPYPCGGGAWGCATFLRWTATAVAVVAVALAAGGEGGAFAVHGRYWFVGERSPWPRQVGVSAAAGRRASVCDNEPPPSMMLTRAPGGSRGCPPHRYR